MLAQSNPTLTGEEWEKYKEFIEVWNIPNAFGASHHWLCPLCNHVTSVKRDACDGCFRWREKKIVGYNRLGNPVEKWVMRK